jgi:ribose transport system substrate-binding protein
MTFVKVVKNGMENDLSRRSKNRAVIYLSLLVLSLVLIMSSCSSKKPPAEKTLKIAVIPMGMTHEFWKSIHAGAVKAGRELGVEVLWKGPQKEDDRDGQVMVVEDFISRGVQGIVLAPLDDHALIRPIQEAKREGIPVVIIDSPLEGPDPISNIATDNYKGGVLAGEHMGQILGGKGRIFLIRCHEGAASSALREKGFYETVLKRFPGIEFLSKDVYAGITTESAYQTLENLLNRFPDVDGIFCPNESTTFGTLRALEDRGLAGKVKFVGFDSSQKLVDGMQKGYIHGLVLQDPFKMGYLGVKTAVAFLRGQPFEVKVDTGETMVTPENMNQPEIQRLLFPPVKDYL